MAFGQRPNCGNFPIGYDRAMDIEKTEFDWFFQLLTVGLGVSLIFYVLFVAPEPRSPPANRLAFGCYMTADGPPILLNQAGMHVMQDDFPPIGFHLERHKQGIVLAAEAPINASGTQPGYHFGISERGVGKLLSFFKVVDGEVFGVFEESELGGFRMPAKDGRYLPYRKEEALICAS